MRPSLALFAAVALASSGNAAAQSTAAPGPAGLDQSYYVAFHGGLHLPQGDAVSDVPGYKFNTGFGGEISLGKRFGPNLAGEIGLGSYAVATDEIATGYVVCDIYGFNCADVTEKGEARATPLVATIKAILPMEGFELYALGGLGLYFVSAKDTWSAAGYGSESHTSSDSPIGIHLGAGAMIPLAPNWKLSLEARYVGVKASLEDINGYSYDVNLNGVQISGGLQLFF